MEDWEEALKDKHYKTMDVLMQAQIDVLTAIIGHIKENDIDSAGKCSAIYSVLARK